MEQLHKIKQLKQNIEEETKQINHKVDIVVRRNYPLEDEEESETVKEDLGLWGQQSLPSSLCTGGAHKKTEI